MNTTSEIDVGLEETRVLGRIRGKQVILHNHIPQVEIHRGDYWSLLYL